MNLKYLLLSILLAGILISFGGCHRIRNSNDEMKALLVTADRNNNVPGNYYAPQANLVPVDSILNASPDIYERDIQTLKRADLLLELGDEQSSASNLLNLLNDPKLRFGIDESKTRKALALTYLRLGERMNCMNNRSAESCIFPIVRGGIHKDKSGSEKAIEIYEGLLQQDPLDLESRWLLNIAYMTIGRYPQGVPAPYLIKGLNEDTSHTSIVPFVDAAINIGLNKRNMSGGCVVDDFNNDGYLDIITSCWDLNSSMHYYRNNKNGSFSDVSVESGLNELTGGLNIMQTDYNNDGFKDIFVLRGAWKGRYGREPNSLLRNNGDGTFTDVTRQAGLLSYHPTQTATWNDFNNDGWLDVFIGNESADGNDNNNCELYINNKNGTFTNIAEMSGTSIKSFVKGVTSGDYDNDGWPDIFISTMTTRKILLKNEGLKNGAVHFRDVTQEAGLANCDARTFGTWFWDYDNDGWLDLFVANYDFNATLGVYAAREALNLPTEKAAKQFLYRNNHDGTFTDVTTQVGLNKIAFAMGCNFGDIDNDGFPDIYLGTGNPNYESVVPNKMFKNVGGKYFVDITTAARVGNLQKGHAVAFADLDNDGDQDIFEEMGGAFPGDAYENALLINPGQNKNNWINISLQGIKCNRAAIGARIKVTFLENGLRRSVYRIVNSGGSFGANPLMQHIGIGAATAVESIEIKWPASGTTQIINQVKPDVTIHVLEGNNKYSIINPQKCDFLSKEAAAIACGVPLKSGNSK